MLVGVRNKFLHEALIASPRAVPIVIHDFFFLFVKWCGHFTNYVHIGHALFLGHPEIAWILDGPINNNKKYCIIFITKTAIVTFMSSHVVPECVSKYTTYRAH